VLSENDISHERHSRQAGDSIEEELRSRKEKHEDVRKKYNKSHGRWHAQNLTISIYHICT
jgi:hypothetical protein